MAETKILNVRLAPKGQLRGPGQLRESMYERRTRLGDNYPMWYLNSTLVQKFKVSEIEGMEAVIAEDKSTIGWKCGRVYWIMPRIQHFASSKYYRMCHFKIEKVFLRFLLDQH